MADQAEEPLIGNGEGSCRDLGEEGGQESQLPYDSTLLQDNLRSPGLFVWLLTFSARISGLLFGCKPCVALCSGPLTVVIGLTSK
jgi:MFS transporter, SP family, solute carrier family 2 (myo-inositol transporter), member 13